MELRPPSLPSTLDRGLRRLLNVAADGQLEDAACGSELAGRR